jgi:hypothetical protein
MVAKSKPKFDFGKPSDSLGAAIDLAEASKGLVLPEGELIRWINDQIYQEEQRRLEIVAKEYGFELPQQNETNRLNLLLNFARAEVSNFSPLTKRRGNPRNALVENGKIFIEVSLEHAKAGVRLKDAIKSVARRRRSKASAVENQFHEARRYLNSKRMSDAFFIAFKSMNTNAREKRKQLG